MCEMLVCVRISVHKFLLITKDSMCRAVHKRQDEDTKKCSGRSCMLFFFVFVLSAFLRVMIQDCA
jgi:hypothetical protein